MKSGTPVAQADEEVVPEYPNCDRCPPRKICLFIEPTPFTHVSGYSNRFKEMLKYLNKAGDQVYILTTDDAVNRPKYFETFSISYTQGFRFYFYNQIMLTLNHELKGGTMIKSKKPDILHVSVPGFFAFPALFYAWKYKVPLVFSYHTNLPKYASNYAGWIPGIEKLMWILIRFVMNHADLNLVTSPQMHNELETHGVKRLHVWQKGIDTDIFNPKFKNREMRYWLSDGHLEDSLLIYVGRLGAEKGLMLLKPVLEMLPNTRLAFVGKGPEMENLKKYFKGTNTFFAGLMEGEMLSRAFASADVFIMPSESETLGFVVLESMASGVPVVAARAGGIPDLIHNGVDSFLVEPKNVGAFVARIRHLLHDNKFYNSMSLAARAEAVKWDWESATSKLRNEQYCKAIANFHLKHQNHLSSNSNLTKKINFLHKNLIFMKSADGKRMRRIFLLVFSLLLASVFIHLKACFKCFVVILILIYFL